MRKLLVFDGSHYRTARLNEAVKLIYSMDAGLTENKNGQTEAIFDLSTLVHRSVLFSNRFYLASCFFHPLHKYLLSYSAPYLAC